MREKKKATERVRNTHLCIGAAAIKVGDGAAVVHQSQQNLMRRVIMRGISYENAHPASIHPPPDPPHHQQQHHYHIHYHHRQHRIIIVLMIISIITSYVQGSMAS